MHRSKKEKHILVFKIFFLKPLASLQVSKSVLTQFALKDVQLRMASALL